MVGLPTVLAMNTGPQRVKTYLLMFMALFMCQNLNLPRTPWKQKVIPFLYNFKCRSLHVLVRQLSALLARVKDEQSYIVLRERTHRNTAESTNARVKWWSIFQMAVLLGEGIFQVWWLKRFFEVSSKSSSTILYYLVFTNLQFQFKVKRVV